MLGFGGLRSNIFATAMTKDAGRPCSIRVRVRRPHGSGYGYPRTGKGQVIYGRVVTACFATFPGRTRGFCASIVTCRRRTRGHRRRLTSGMYRCI